MLRLAHFSDIHLTARSLGWSKRDFLSKKVSGWVNVRMLGRGSRFKHGPRITEILRQEFAGRNYDHLIFSGDVTGLGFESEFVIAAKLLGVTEASHVPCIAVPGNHDYYTRHSAKQLFFDKHFAPWIVGQRIGEHVYPFAKKAGDAWLIAVNSATANWWTFDASGAIGSDQLARLKELCQTLDAGPRILVTHYPLRASRRQVEHRSHRLRDHAAALATAKECGISLWLHGHIHTPYYLEAGGELPFPTICAGSCTQTNRWCYNDYTLTGDKLVIVQRKYDFAAHRFNDGYTAELTLKIPEILKVDA